MVETQLYIITQISTYNYMFRPRILAIVRLYYDLTFKNRASYMLDGRTATLQMLHFIYFFQQI